MPPLTHHHCSEETRHVSARRVWAGWLMAFLLAFPTAFISPSMARWISSPTEESVPTSVAEELREEARIESDRWQVTDGGAQGNRYLPVVRHLRAARRLSLVEITRPAERVARNGCGAALRC